MASDSGTLYVGFTGNLEQRVQQHKQGVFNGFSKKYDCKKLVYYEEGSEPLPVIEREKQIKKWSRKKKEFLINTINSSWNDLSKG